jgi:hypothetical protein
MENIAGLTIPHRAGTAMFTYDDTGWIVMVFHTCGELRLIGHRRTLHQIQYMAWTALEAMAREDARRDGECGGGAV